MIRLTFHGAARTVTGSKHLLEIGQRKILIDAGMFQGRKDLRLMNWSGPAFDPASIDTVLLTHTHIDHVGMLPRLTKLGLEAPVYMTPAAYDLAELMLLDAAKIQEEDARWANRKGYSKHKPALPLFDTDDARAALELRRAVGYHETLDLGNGIEARFLQAGHLLGSAFIEVSIPTDAGRHRIVFSGDIGRFEVPLHLDPEPRPDCDTLVLESTYGDRTHTDESVTDQIGEALTRCLDQGGTVLIPAFAVGRSQQITLILRRLMRAGKLPQVPIHLDSPMAITATKIYSRHLNEENLDADIFEDGRLHLFPDEVHTHRTTDESKALNSLRGPRILVSSSGMLTGGRILHHLARLGPDPKNLLMLVGYQAWGTRGRQILEGAEPVKMFGHWVKIRCQVLSLHGLSGHGDRDELLRWAASAPTSPSKIFLVHGELEPARSLATSLAEQHPEAEIAIPELEETVKLA